MAEHKKRQDLIIISAAVYAAHLLFVSPSQLNACSVFLPHYTDSDTMALYRCVFLQ
jgi:hypothetical protein